MGSSAVCRTRNLSAANDNYYSRIALEEMVKYLDQASRLRAKTFPVPKLARSHIDSERRTARGKGGIQRMLMEHLMWIRCGSCNLVALALVLSLCALVKKETHWLKKKLKCQGNGPCTRSLKIALSFLLWLRGCSVLQSGVTKFRISQGRERCARIKCLPMFLKLPAPFSSSLGVAQASACDQRSMA